MAALTARTPNTPESISSVVRTNEERLPGYPTPMLRVKLDGVGIDGEKSFEFANDHGR